MFPFSTRYRFLPVIAVTVFLFLLWGNTAVYSQERTEISLPDIPGYKTLKCEFHIHTVFSDGEVWPTVRVKESWEQGLDALAITDHIEIQAYPNDIRTDLNRAYELAAPVASAYGILLIKGAEITKPYPRGHYNALFVSDINPLKHENTLKAITEAGKQGAFIMWNHPGFLENGELKYYDWQPEQETAYKQKLLHGIEVVNGNYYYANAHKWCLEKGLTMIGSTDAHTMVNYLYNYQRGEHRTLTLVFSKEQTVESIKDALMHQRTAVYWADKIIGTENFLKPLFAASVRQTPEILFIDGNGSGSTLLANETDMPYSLTESGSVNDVSFPEKMTIPPHRSVLFTIKVRGDIPPGFGTYCLPYTVKNLITAPGKSLKTGITVKIFSLLNVAVNPAEGRSGSVVFYPELGEDLINLFYSTEGSLPTPQSFPAYQPLKAENPVTVQLAAYKNGMLLGSPVTKTVISHRGLSADIHPATEYSKKYSSSGERAVIDGVLASEEYADHAWQGYEGQDFRTVIDLKDQENLSSLTMRFLQNTGVWIFLPTVIIIETSEDGINFAPLKRIKNTVSPKKSGAFIKEFTVPLKNRKIRYIEIAARNIGACPPWHPGSGKPAWLFTDEVVIK